MVGWIGESYIIGNYSSELVLPVYYKQYTPIYIYIYWNRKKRTGHADNFVNPSKNENEKKKKIRTICDVVHKKWSRTT